MTANFWQEKHQDTITLGLTADAQQTMGKIKFVELPKVGTQLTAGHAFMNVEAEKTVLDLDAPVSGTVVTVNEAAIDDPSLLDETAHSANWVVTLKA